MSDIGITYIGNQAANLKVAPQFDGYSKVVLMVNDEEYFEKGTDTGRTLTLTNPFGTQKMCDDIYKLVAGYAYQPIDAEDALLDPAAELGDGMIVKGTYGGLYSAETTFSSVYHAHVSAPYDEELDHEYPYKSPSERQVTRRFGSMSADLKVQADQISAEVAERKADSSEIRATLSVQAGKIDAKVEKQGGNNSFGWSMTDTDMTWKANGSEIFRLNKNGAKVTGEIRATSGVIGGFTIKSNSLTYNNQTWGGTNSNGIYIGPSGIQLGKNFKVDSAGNLTAASGTFTGSVSAGNIQYGGDAGYFSGSGISGGSISGSKIEYGTITTSNTSGGINSSLGYANWANGVFNGYDSCPWIITDYIKLSGHILNFTSIDGKKVIGWS